MMLIDEYNVSYIYMYKLDNQLNTDCNTFQKVFENQKIRQNFTYYHTSY